jgi:hypothetical protein
MHLTPGFAFTPLQPTPIEPHPQYGPLILLPGHWAGGGFNLITRPFHDPAGKQTRFLELNLTNETIDFALIEGAIPNRGRFQDDIAMYGVTYLQQISDANLSTPDKIAGLHAEPGVWANVPATTSPAEPPTVVRMASIPHGTAIIAQGTAVTQEGPPDMAEPASPYPNGHSPGSSVPFIVPEAHLATKTIYRSSGKQMDGITQDMVSFPVTTFLKAAIAHQTILSTVTLAVSTKSPDRTDPTVTAGGGTANTAFLEGGTSRLANARTAQVDATFWIEQIKGEQGAPDFLQLQYRQTVFLEFDGFFWPHVTVATLRKMS